jgi:DNA-binding transcriptional LysR family regulator
MSRRYFDLPPFTSLTAFEAAARHLSFKTAAQELSVTPGAVSHQIKALERELGTPLFQRLHRGVALTSEGLALFETLSVTFGQISRQLTRIRQIGEDATVTVGSTTAVAALWLSPAIIQFWRQYPQVKVNQVTQDRVFQSLSGFDFVISYGKSKIPSVECTPLYRDELVAVAAPELASALAGGTLEQVAQRGLIHLDAENPSWTQWPEWFKALGYEGDLSTSTKVTSYSIALQIAQNGTGIALGWRRLVQPTIDSGALAVIEPYAIAAPHQFYLAGLPHEDLSENAKTLKAWLINEAQSTPD